MEMTRATTAFKPNMRSRRYLRFGLWLSATVLCDFSSLAQLPPVAAPQEEKTTTKPDVPCVEPAPIVTWKDYNGPLRKTVGIFGRALERKSVHQPHYKPGVLLCSLELKDKFTLFVEDSLDPAAFLDTAFWAGIDQASDRDPAFGQGASGYGKRFAANFADQASSNFFKDFAYPAIFSEDPRYYRLAHGKRRTRLLHAVSHAFVAYRVDGTRMPNYSQWLGTASAVALANAYHPGNTRGVGPAAQRVGLSIAQDIGFDVLREFWPEISRKLNLPFRGSSEPGSDSPVK
jgi:hypothetical protein